jgi:hypothetical protein
MATRYKQLTDYFELMELKTFLQQLRSKPDSIAFTDTIAVIDALYNFTPTAFKNGELMNEAGQNNGSCKLFAFAQLQNLTPAETLACFGVYYRDDVLKHPGANDHQNIRNFIKHGWGGIKYQGNALKVT